MAPARSIVKYKLQANKQDIKKQLRKLQTRQDVADLLEVPIAFLTHILHNAKERDQYKSFEIPKKSGGVREIDSPTKNIKILQGKLNYALRFWYHEHSAAHGFVKKKSIATNAQIHAGQLWILNIDLKDFFHSVHIGRIAGALCSPTFGFGKEASTVIAQIATRGDGVMPQGSPLSPLISNIVAYELDKQLTSKSRSLKAKYSRYADDITISTNRPSFPTEFAVKDSAGVVVSQSLRQTIESCGFELNAKKTSLNRRSQRLEVTGLVVNEFPNVDRHYIRQTRTVTHLWRKHGQIAATEILSKWVGHTVTIDNYLRGRIAYLAMIRGKGDPVVRKLAKQLNDLAPGNCAWLTPVSELKPVPLGSRYGAFMRRERVGNLLAKSTVQLSVTKNGDQQVGSAFFVSPTYLATAGHNCDGTSIEIELETGKVPVSIVDYRNKVGGLDVGLLHVNNSMYESKSWMTLNMRLPEYGEDVLAGGFPPVQWRDSTLSVFAGIVESLPTSYSKDTRFIQIGMHSPGGLSGGPLMDMKGTVIGIMVENTFKSGSNHENENDSGIGQNSLAPERVFGQAMPIEYFIDLWRKRIT